MSAYGNIKVAVLGGGYWGKNLVRNFHELDVLKWVCDVDQGTLESLKEKHGDIQTTTNYQDVLEDQAVNAIVIASPAGMHYEHAIEAMRHGKDVFVEKPLALSLSRGREITEIANTNGTVLMVGHILEYHPAVKNLKRLVEAGELGDILYVYSNRLNLGKVRQEESILWSFAPHDISIISGLIGSRLESVSASAGFYLQDHIADVTVTNLSYAGGVKSHIFVSWLHPYKEMKLIAIGNKKMAVFNDTAKEDKLKIYDIQIKWEADRPVPRQDSETTIPLEAVEPMREECEHFLQCVRDRSKPLTGGQNALQVLQILQACELSIKRNGAPVSLQEAENIN